jgi:hypothetical protein
VPAAEFPARRAGFCARVVFCVVRFGVEAGLVSVDCLEAVPDAPVDAPLEDDALLEELVPDQLLESPE